MTSFSFQLFHKTILCTVPQLEQLIMVEEFEKYKGILDRECDEFRQELEREVSAFLPFHIDREKLYLN